MKDFFDLDGPFFQGIIYIVDMAYATCLFLLCSLPIITIGASWTALYYTMHKTIRHGHGYVGEEFFSCFKQNFKQSTLVWLLLLAIYGVLGTECYLMYQYAILGQAIGKSYILLMIVIAFVVVWNLYLFPYIARFENKTSVVLKNAAFFAFGNFVPSLIMFVLLVFFMLLIVSWPVLVVLLPAVYGAICERLLEKIFVRYMSEEDKKAEEERNKEYKSGH